MHTRDHSSRSTLLRLFIVCTAVFAGTAQAVTSIRIADWNMANHPNNATDDSELKTILGAMSTNHPVDVLAMAETDTGSAPDTATDFNSYYGTTTYQNTVASADGGGDRTGFIYNSATVQLISTAEIGTGVITHPTLRAQFRPVGTTGSQDFYYYAVHLMSGSSTAIHTTRGTEAAVLRADAATLAAGTNIIVAGDFNWQGADEAVTSGTSAYRVFSATGSGQVQDVINQVGAWHANAAYEPYMTEDPGSNLDDRFDMQLVSSTLKDGQGLDYLNGSYTVVGNNGTIPVGGTFANGTGLSSTLTSALDDFSDHLPVYADYTVPEPSCIAAIAFIGVTATRRRRAA